MPLTPEDVRNKEFSLSGLGRRGYDEKEVDDFLLDVQAELERLGRENARLAASSAAGDASPAAPAPAGSAAALPTSPALGPDATAPGPDASAASADPAKAPAAAARILELAQRTADEHMAEARAQAEQLVTSAQTRADELARDADERQRRVVGETEEQRAALERQVEGLRAFEREYRSRLTAYLESQLAELAGRAGDAPEADRALPAGGPRVPDSGDDSTRLDRSSVDGTSAGESHDPPRQ